MKPVNPLNYYKSLFYLIILISGTVQAQVVEVEDNNTIQTAQRVDVSTGSASISAVLGTVTGTEFADLDFFRFSAQAGDIITLDIDGGVGGLKSFDSYIAVFDSNGLILRENDDAPTLDAGSISTYDSRIDDFKAPTTGEYIVGISNMPRQFLNGGTVISNDGFQNGDYTLNITGITPTATTIPTAPTTPPAPTVQQINIDIKPGDHERTTLNPRSKGKIPVALLSSGEFNALNVDISSLTFGATGNEVSLSHCNPRGHDVNRDGFDDLLCFFENQQAGFVQGNLEAKLRGKLKSGSSFEGKSILKVMSEKGSERRSEKRHNSSYNR